MPSRPLPPPLSSLHPVAAAAARHKPSPARVRVLLIALTVSLSSLLLLALLFLLLYLYFSLLDRSSPTLPFDSAAAAAATPPPHPPPLLPLRRFSYRELRCATGGFDAAHSLGRGGCGSVFRGVLPDGKTVAVKRMDPAAPVSSSASVSAAAAMAADREFQNELQVLGAISSPYVVSLLGYCVERKKKLLVYEYMSNRSLQEALFGSGSCDGTMAGSPDLDWDRRFKIILDVAQGLTFLHLECDPPVIHGDIKPSNVLLGSDFRAKISDFGLSRVKTEGADLGFELYSQEFGRSEELWRSQELVPAGNTPDGANLDLSLALRAPSSSKKNPKVNNEGSRCRHGCCPKGKESAACDDELSSVDFSRELNGNASSSPMDDGRGDTNQWGTDWWWKQDGNPEVCSKDYVQEWIGNQICPSRNPDWDDDDDDKKSSPKKSDVDSSLPTEKLDDKNDTLIQFSSLSETQSGGICDKKHKKMREWWKEEYFAEINKKGKCSRRFRWFQPGRSSRDGAERAGAGGDGGLTMDISFRKGWKKRKRRSCSAGSDVWSGDLFSRELSSTTSMRGTVCYVAPEYGGCGYLMEKADIYSFGVLILVIVSGRRPLHVLSSPMKLEKANLISWCRQLAQAGNVLELVDERMKQAYDKDQASLCINLALLCLQRIPELRPDSGDIVRILRGEVELPPLPVEFSPSPSSKLFRSRSRRRPAPSEAAE